MRNLAAATIGFVLLGAGMVSADEAKLDPKSVLLNVYREVFNAHNVAALDKYTVADFVDHNADPGQKPGLAGLKTAFADMFAGIPDLKIEVLQTVVQGDVAVARVTMSGTQKGPFMGKPASGRPFKIGGMDMVRVKDGKGTERWGYYDFMAMDQQLWPPKAPKAP